MWPYIQNDDTHTYSQSSVMCHLHKENFFQWTCRPGRYFELNRTGINIHFQLKNRFQRGCTPPLYPRLKQSYKGYLSCAFPANAKISHWLWANIVSGNGLVPLDNKPLPEYLSQCWPRSMSPHGVTSLQWVNCPSNGWQGDISYDGVTTVNVIMTLRILSLRKQYI